MSDSATPWIAARQASLSITNSRSSLRLMSIESVMPLGHLTLCHPLLLLPSILLSIGIFLVSWLFAYATYNILYVTLKKVIFSRWVTVFKNSWNGFVNTLCNFDLLGNLWVSFQFFWPLWFQYIHQNSQLWADGPFILNYFWLLRILAKQKDQINCLDFVIVGWTFGIEQQ